MRSAPALNAAIVPPSPSAPQRDLPSVRVPGSQAVSVIPPPVSAPEQATDLHARLTLPAPAVIAPPPTQITHDISPRGPGYGTGTMQNQVVPPPASMTGASTANRTFGGLGNANVVPPPVQLNGAATGSRAVAGLGNASVVPPPVQVGGGSLQHPAMGGLGGGTAVVPPPPSVSGAGSPSGMGRGNRGTGLGGPMDAGSVAAPPSSNGGSGRGTGVVVSSQPGSKIGVPGNGGAGSLAMSPSGGDKAGVGGSGGGSGIGRGTGPGSGLSGEGSGAAKEGIGHGSETTARGGISPYPGPGGAGTGTSGKPPMPGVSVSGGSNIVTLPSFGADGGGPNIIARSSVGKDQEGPGITVVGTARSGGAFNYYGMLKGDKVYTIYFDTVLGTAVYAVRGSVVCDASVRRRFGRSQAYALRFACQFEALTAGDCLHPRPFWNAAKSACLGVRTERDDYQSSGGVNQLEIPAGLPRRSTDRSKRHPRFQYRYPLDCAATGYGEITPPSRPRAPISIPRSTQASSPAKNSSPRAPSPHALPPAPRSIPAG